MKKEYEIICVRDGITYRRAPFDGQQAIDQRLRKLIEVVMEVGRREGLIGNHKEEGTNQSEGGRYVADKRDLRDCKAPASGKNQARNQAGR